MSMSRRHQRGFTLIELIIFIVVVGAGMAGILSVMNAVVKSSADPLVRKQTIAIAESLLEEILLRQYMDSARGAITTCTSRAGTTRTDWVDVCDYQGYTTASGIVNSLEEAVSGLEKYTINPTVIAATTDLAGLLAFSVRVSVTGPGETISLTGYRANDTLP